MLKRRIDLPSFDNVSAGNKALVSAFIGPRYHNVTLRYAESGTLANLATLIAGIDEVVFKLDGVEQWRVDPEYLIKVEEANNPNYSFKDGFLPLNFTTRVENGFVQQEDTAVGTLGVGTFEIEVYINSGATSPTLEAMALVDDMAEAPGLIRKISQRELVINSTGPLKEPIRRRGISYRGVSFFEATAGDIDKVRLQHEGRQIVDHTPDEIEAMEAEYGYTRGTKHVFLPLDHKVRGDAMPSQVKTANGQFRDAATELTLTMGAAANVVMLEDVYGAPNA